MSSSTSLQQQQQDDWPTKRSSSMMMNRNSSIDEYDEPTFHQNVSRYSQDDTSVISISEYYDAEDKVSPSDYNSTTSEEEEDDDESVITDFSEDGCAQGGGQMVAKTGDADFACTGRRTKLPSVQPSSQFAALQLFHVSIQLTYYFLAFYR